jgi:hypothetical protein
MTWYCNNCKKNRDVIGFVGELGIYDKDTTEQEIKNTEIEIGIRCAECDSNDMVWKGKSKPTKKWTQCKTKEAKK